ncbi:hypothetical protein [Aureimonas leprariae]|uniref:Uncharacterized protein n=1 Tax=Plantimonas leprariae TaxID=2615207 RepID=A0A7V7PMA7_9HYPH|nr:hypothetical protein [Aureimonas leprariae]KAB0677786.1 hypothetical protein F6X38_17560 [Aureimonas leprariae]
MVAHATTFLDQKTIIEIAWPILTARLEEFGVNGLLVEEEIDFDGEPILRLNVVVDRPYTARAMMDARDAIRVQLLKRDDQRSVYFRPMSGQPVK